MKIVSWGRPSASFDSDADDTDPSGTDFRRFNYIKIVYDVGLFMYSKIPIIRKSYELFRT